MDMRPFRPADLGRLLELTIATFGPFYEQSFRGIVGDTVMANQHGNWREDYRNQWQGLHDPENGKYVVVAEDHDEIVGFIAWTIRPQKRSGEVEIIAVEPAHRRHHVASTLCAHAFDDLRRHGIEVVSLGTGGDEFHAPARALYDSLGMTPLPVVVYYKALLDRVGLPTLLAPELKPRLPYYGPCPSRKSDRRHRRRGPRSTRRRMSPEDVHMLERLTGMDTSPQERLEFLG